MSTAKAFVTSYTEADADRVAFAWNGKHAAEFIDSNADFRREVVAYCIDHPDEASPALLETLFRTDAAWSREAWCAPNHFSKLAEVLLVRGGDSILDTFALGFGASFDTFGACHQMQLPHEVLGSLRPALHQLITAAGEPARRERLEAVSELFEKLSAGTASRGWARVEPGTPVSNIRVVQPYWHQRLWRRFTSIFQSPTA